MLARSSRVQAETTQVPLGLSVRNPSLPALNSPTHATSRTRLTKASLSTHAFEGLRKSHELMGLVNRKRREKHVLLRANTVVGVASIIILLVHMEMRRSACATADVSSCVLDADDDEARAMLIKFNVLRTAEVLLTVCLVTFTVCYHYVHGQLLISIGHRRTSSRTLVHHAGFLLRDVLPLLVGVLPPGVEATWEMTPTAMALAADSEAAVVVLHVDVYCLCQFVRVLLLTKWVMYIHLPPISYKSPVISRLRQPSPALSCHLPPHLTLSCSLHQVYVDPTRQQHEHPQLAVLGADKPGLPLQILPHPLAKGARLPRLAHHVAVRRFGDALPRADVCFALGRHV